MWSVKMAMLLCRAKLINTSAFFSLIKARTTIDHQCNKAIRGHAAQRGKRKCLSTTKKAEEKMSLVITNFFLVPSYHQKQPRPNKARKAMK